ncbi:MAG: hypothetical protein AAB520_03680 [Patescibacteria group bacterium]
MIYDKDSLSKLNFNFSKKKLLLVGFLFAVLLIIPLTVYLVQQQQQSQSRANPNTTLTFTPASQTAPVGGKVNFDVILTPGNNQVNFVKLVIKYDSTKLETDEKGFTLDPTTDLSIIQGPTAENDTLSVVLSVESDKTKVIQQATKIGSVSFNVIGASDTPTQVSFDSDPDTGVQIRSLNGDNQDAFDENVFLNGTPASVTIQGEGITPTPGVTETPTPEPTTAETPTPEPTSSGNTAPICESLAADATTGTAPFTVNFTVTGNDTDGTIDKVTFNYGDGPVEDIATGSGITTDSVSLTQAHTYQTSGAFTATAIMTDNSNGVSDTVSCTASITVSGGGELSPSTTVTPLADVGPRETFVGIGALGGILFLIGALLFFAL